MRPFRIPILPSLTTLAVAIALAALYLHFRPLEIPRLARVDIGRLVARQQQVLVQRIQPGMAVDEQGKLFEEAKAFGAQLDAALDQVAQECQCALINSAALLKASSVGVVPDLTARVMEIVRPVPNPSAK